jgi:hypothetical protein
VKVLAPSTFHQRLFAPHYILLCVTELFEEDYLCDQDRRTTAGLPFDRVQDADPPTPAPAQCWSADISAAQAEHLPAVVLCSWREVG